jgi:hypothetical protein
MDMQILISIEYLSGTLNASELILRSLNWLVSADSKGRVMGIGALVETERKANLEIIEIKADEEKAVIKIKITEIEEEISKEMIINQIKNMTQRFIKTEKTQANIKVEKAMIRKQP